MSPSVRQCLFRNARLPDGSSGDLAVCDGLFVNRHDLGEAVDVYDLDGLLVLPGFVDGHIHLDKSFVGDRWRPHRSAKSLDQRLQIEKQMLAEALPTAERADALLTQVHRSGTVAVRSHVDVDATVGLSNLHDIMEAKARWRDRVDIEIVAFPQAGILRSPGTADLLDAAVREGATVVGGLDPTTFDGDADAHLDVVFGIAERHGVKIDIHLHEPGLRGTEQIRRIAARTSETGMGGRVTISHGYALGEVGDGDLARTAELLSRAEVAIMTNAPGDRKFPPVARLRSAGVRLFAGSDNIRDAWWPYGDGDMLGRAMMVSYRSGFGKDADLECALEMATTASATVLGLEGYGLAPGDRATFVILDAPTAAAAVAAPPAARRLVQRGRMLPMTPSRLNAFSHDHQNRQGNPT